MTILEDGKSWSDLLLSPAAEAHVAAVVAGTKMWLMRSGGLLAVREAERVGDMMVLCGVDHVSGHASCTSVPAAEIEARAAA